MYVNSICKELLFYFIICDWCKYICLDFYVICSLKFHGSVRVIQVGEIDSEPHDLTDSILLLEDSILIFTTWCYPFHTTMLSRDFAPLPFCLN
ncbi:hypothetical protein DICPUDRAFT_159266 [Dictyostelium purpureum]|uniref:Uncharacterized protein n=1 Tax=Dictyostelium purpureum TaxID=5786 RepID=F1A3P3_DICPU|nr:uncharacterized protein DICPUDRAFT_159266 [Dictyostelium purpureum]EGC29188.1 hypothetical protein DICPUDRAFT_159266 [Dictyostelium purpureum]|eukprot:XP_003294283.1 hypothetical protein DICPUDRAFT_159266 [Dictyostelium purpureum]